MPTSKDEVVKIQQIINSYLSEDKAREVTIKLDEEVGQITDNDSLKLSLRMLRSLYDA